jgi:hypothetical protein
MLGIAGGIVLYLERERRRASVRAGRMPHAVGSSAGG